MKKNDVTIDPNSNPSWNVTQVEDSGTGYEVFWSHSSGQFEVWKVGASGNYEFKVTAHLWQHEKTFKVDLNGDGTTGLRAIETTGDVHLALGDNKYSGDTKYYIVDGIKAPIALTKAGAPRGPTDGGWNVTQVENSGEGYEVFWARSSGRFEVWKVDDSGNYESHVTAHLWQHENTFGVDLNGDGTTGLRAIETTGDVHLALGDNKYSGDTKYYIVDGIKAPIALTKAGAPRGPTDGGWNVTQVENSGEGYEVFWARSSGRFEVWKVDDSGNYESHVTAHLWQHENTFGVDLNGDGTTGLRAIETTGDVHLALGDNKYSGDTKYYIVDGIKAPIALTKAGAPRGPTDGGWNVTQVENSGEGYEVFWARSSGRFEVWKVDDSGNYESHVTAHLWQHENTFGVDLNGDGTTGLRAIETTGDVHLALGDNKYSGDTKYYIVDGIKAPIALTKAGAPRGPTDGGWNVTQVENSGEGYEVFWARSSGRSEVWKVDDSGNYESHVTAHLWQHENTFGVDPNGDGTTGLRAIETTGDVHLALGDNKYSGDTKYYIVDGIKAPIALTKAGAPRGPTDGGWNVTQVENSGEGYEVFWARSSGRFEVWKVDDSGNYESHVTAHLWQHENTFGVDLNGDGTTGLRAIETTGDVHLALGDNKYSGDTKYYIVDGIKAPIALTKAGAPRGPTDGGWNVTQVENSGEGYEVFWARSSGRFEVWKVDDSGNYESHVTAHLWQHENTFGVDLNGDGTTGLRAIETTGDVHLALGDNKYSGDTKYYIVDGIKAPIALTKAGAPRGPTDGGWNVTQVENSGEGYEVFWARSSGRFEVWKVDDSGNYESHVTAHLWQHENTFGVDLNGDGIDSGNNNIYGSIGNDTFDGGAGDDIINGREGHDTLIGGEGNDWLSGDGGSGYAGNDILFGNAGNDDLRGRDGNDQIDGGTGSDTITTGSGLDKIILRIGDGGNTLSDADIITDFTDGSDDFRLHLVVCYLFAKCSWAQGSGDYASDTII